MEKELFSNNNLLSNNGIRSNSEKDKNIIGKTKIVMLKPNIASSPNLRNNFKLEKVKDLKNLILSEKDKNRYILVKKDNSSNLSTILCKNI